MEPVDLSFLEPAPRNPDPTQLAAVRPPIAALNNAQKLKRTKQGDGRTCRSCADILRRFLNSKKLGHLDEQGRTRFIRMLDNMVRIASSKSPQAVAAFVALMDRAYGKARPHEDELDAIAKGGIQLVYLAQTELDGDVKSAKNILPPKPEFIEGEFEEVE